MKCISQKQQCQATRQVSPSRACVPSVVVCQASTHQHTQPITSQQYSSAAATRRTQLLGTAAMVPASLLAAAPQALAAKAPKGFTAYEDTGDGYKFLYPFGWQEVAVTGADVVFKDIVEPLESVSVTITTTDKKDITEFGGKEEVADTLAKEVLTPPGQEVTIVSSEQRDLNGKPYYEFEFTAKNSRYTRHSVAVVAAENGKFYTLTTGANERRWGKVKDRLKTTIRSFTLLY